MKYPEHSAQRSRLRLLRRLREVIINSALVDSRNRKTLYSENIAFTLHIKDYFHVRP